MSKASLKNEYTKRNYVITNVSQQTKYPGDELSYPTTHSAFIIPLSGNAIISFGKKNFFAREGYVVNGAPGHLLTFKVMGNEPFVHLNIYYDADNIWDSKTNWMNTLYAISIKDNTAVKKLIPVLQNICYVRNWDEFMQRDVLAKQLIMKLFLPTADNDSAYQAVLVAEYIRANFAEKLTLKKIADNFSMNESHLSYMFAKRFHIRPIDYLILIRLKKAAELLSQGHSVNETAELVGYSDALYFSRLFKKHYGFAPSYLKNERNRAGKEDNVPEDNLELIII